MNARFRTNATREKVPKKAKRQNISEEPSSTLVYAPYFLNLLS